MTKQKIEPNDTIFYGREPLTLSYIFDSYNKINCSSSSKTILRESFAQRIRIPEFTNVPKNDLRHFCKYCYFPWTEGNFSMKVLPKKVPGKRILKLLKKKTMNPKKLSKFEKNLIQFVEQDHGNKLVLVCSLCKKKTIKPMLKDKNLIKVSIEEPFEEPFEEQEKLNKKKKKKKKDIFVGLRKDVVLKSIGLHEAEQHNFQTNFQNKTGISDLGNKSGTNSKLINKLLAANKKGNYKNVPSEKTLTKGNIGTNKNNQKTSASEKCNKQITSFFQKQEEKWNIEYHKKREAAAQNKHTRKMLQLQMKKNKKSNFTDFKNFLRDFGKPV